MNKTDNLVEQLNSTFELIAEIKVSSFFKTTDLAITSENFNFDMFKRKLKYFNQDDIYKKLTMREKTDINIFYKLLQFWEEKRKNNIIVDSTMVGFKRVNGLLYLDFKDENVRNLSGF